MKRTTKRKIKKRLKTITGELLWFLRDMGELIPYPFEGKYQYIKRLKYYDRYKISRAFWELDRDGLVKKIKKERKTYYQITNLGRARSLKYIYSRKLRRAKNNGFSTLVMFDIPEEKKKARQFLRRFLIQNGFMMLQKSVFIGPWELLPEFKELLKELQVELNVNILEGRMLFDSTQNTRSHN
ncbi:MAG: CRISPR-associated endonuclease Cas2 [Candidatus Doudnabacteria bacterium RIFCSPLOWO2_02_FULL_42_9]|uniref:CRISPR-associated endonuclease Cas2 n=1 Tax=Candidatus Doudnabacteria bacterium RIFCSPHIGHO2_01_FULL_41_86 TaxID=1817821 RepID=A0A1F5N9F9_9BACT|nr:MAG: CRISPR-associated endonuclease Cas2 [Candidatus Doudnabacteria bacterium RIFCSPHIGHO2_01_FULL_41_86]OGE74885.1 MAG: CRISPR-associated endonuclease Cas2 [Candidatus Doudnabacteria bacterium RIFCSPHIGHO2_01_43_10]OGE85231.1 MAG: CRISPR-associated endonuclease Cas2 [Candidatus Doudnabacteria bacterium RIFCSPHIGHO2_12_FULL_42_22]OGE86769.1 MAG: CRISPR-associated endonuclease Cas2 [Candidatus Doudnabacteria bacterium RIFCSPHIGHO2_02_FULL_42_25]OGE92367.1 MAG: CRISPR-associated endonuclease C